MSPCFGLYLRASVTQTSFIVCVLIAQIIQTRMYKYLLLLITTESLLIEQNGMTSQHGLIHSFILSILLFTGEIDYSSDPWPFKDEVGFYQSHQENGAWVNWWSRQKPSVFSLFLTFMRSPDQSGISDTQRIERELPITKPYWLSANEETTHKKVRDLLLLELSKIVSM